MSEALDAVGPLLHWLDSERDRQLDFLQQFARIDTANPPGDTRRAADFFRAFLDREGIAHRTEAPQAAHPNLIATFAGGAGSGRHLVLNGHLDVFPVGDRAAWARDPWSGEIADGRMHGRGTVDMKCGTTALLFVFAYLYRLRAELPGFGRVFRRVGVSPNLHAPQIVGPREIRGQPFGEFRLRLN